MQVVDSLEKLDAILAECDAAPDDDALRAIFARFRMDPAAWVADGTKADPLGQDYHAGQMALYRRISGRAYALDNEETPFDVAAAVRRPFPYSTGSLGTAGQHLITIGQFLCGLDLPPGARVLEFGPGWGNLTLALAGLGYDVTAVDVEARFCTLIRERAARLDLPVKVINADFTWATSVAEPFDAIVFFECFHHAADHLHLLRTLHGALKPGGRIYLGAEPILADFPVPWGLRLDGQSLWSIRKFGWMELGFSDAYFERALAATGWRGTRLDRPEPGTWVLRRTDEPVRIPATSPKLGTVTGTRTARGIAVDTAAEGYCLFGPYMPLPAGRYVVAVEFDAGTPVTGSGVIDACVGSGSNVLASRGFSSGDAMPPLSISFDLPAACTDLEVRIWGEAGFAAVITALTITPVAHPGPG
ncbi:MAG: class I SAM-dependent methyltransferase [Janthinobacterium lividum]